MVMEPLTFVPRVEFGATFVIVLGISSHCQGAWQ